MTDAAAEPVRRGVVAVIVRARRLLVIRRSDQVVAPGRLCFPGGGLEGDETESAALIRELREELGVAVSPGLPLWRSVTRWRVALSWWLADLHAEEVLRPNPAEVAAVHWMSPAELAAEPTLLASNHAFLAALAQGEIPALRSLLAGE